MRGSDTTSGQSCPFSGQGAAAGPESTGGTLSRRSMLTALAGLAVLPVVGGIGGTAQAAPRRPPVVPAAPRRPARATRAPTPSATRAAATSPSGRAGTRRPGSASCSRTCRRSARPTGCCARWPRDERRQGAADRRQGLSDVAFDNPGIPAGYIYFGQFVDHDMTLDKTPLTKRLQDPRAMRNYDTPVVRPGQRLRQGRRGQPGALRPGPARLRLLVKLGARRPGRPAPATTSARPTSATRATTRTSSSPSCTRLPPAAQQVHDARA